MVRACARDHEIARRVCDGITRRISEIARSLQSHRLMPRKQRFKPSRKPQQPNQTIEATQQASDRQESVSSAQDIEKPAPVREQTGDSDEVIR